MQPAFATLRSPPRPGASDDAVGGLRELRLADYDPESTLVSRSTSPARARCAAIDFHAHLGRWLASDGDWMTSDLDGRHDHPWMVSDVQGLVALLDEHNVCASVNLDGRWGRELEANLDRYDRAHPDRFFTFCQVDLRLAGERADFGAALERSLRESADAGARGLKVWKTLGLGFRDASGELIKPDDERLSPLFAAAGELGLPVLIHTGDPVAFFRPLDRHNERLEEILRHPEWSFHRPGLPSHGELMESFEALVAAHPRTTFVGAHLAGWVENLAWVSRMLRDYSNLHVDIAARTPDLGRQPRAARRLVLEHPRRVLFGTDELPPSAAGYRRYFRFLETRDESYAYADDRPPTSGRWTVSALRLPGDVLRAVYAKNARQLLGLGPQGSGA